MSKVLCLLSIASSFLIMSSVARAESVRSALTDFGLVGTWSTDCSKDLSKEVGSRITYTVPFFGRPTRVGKNIFRLSPEGDLLESDLKEEIDDAARVTEDKIVLRIKPTELKFPKGQDQGQIAYNPYQSVLQKFEFKVRLMERKAIDAPIPPGEVVIDGHTLEGFELPLLERCLN